MKSITWYILASALILSMVYYSGCRGERSRWEKQLAKIHAQLYSADSTIVRLRVDSASLANQYKTDTLILTKQIVKWKDVVKRVYDTTPGRVDTLTKIQIVHIADSTINSCNNALATCNQLRQNAEGRAAVLVTANDDLKRLLSKPPSLFTVQFPRVVTSVLVLVGISFAFTRIF